MYQSHKLTFMALSNLGLTQEQTDPSDLVLVYVILHKSEM